MRSGRPCREKASPGSMGIGARVVATMSGSPAHGNGHPTPAPTGPTPTTTTPAKADRYMKGTGTAKTTAITTTIITIMGTTITTTMTARSRSSLNSIRLNSIRKDRPGEMPGLSRCHKHCFNSYLPPRNQARPRSNSRGIESAHPDSPVLSPESYACPTQARHSLPREAES
jgi:hypothetical protein